MRTPRTVRELEIKNKSAMQDFWQTLSLQSRQIILLKGNMGAGKTQSVLWLAQRLGAHDAASPSFALHNIYAIGGDQPVIDHFDLYRLENEDDLESTGFWDVFDKDEGLIIIEWPERLSISDLPMYWSLLEVEIQVPDAENQPEARKLIVKEY